MDMSGCHGVALFGLGRAGKIHFKNIRLLSHRAKILWIIDNDVDAASKYVEEFKMEGTKICSPSDADKVYQDDRVDSVIICTTTSSHEPILRQALNHGKHVFCEKPLASTSEATVTCYEDAKKHGKVLFCSFNRRFDPAIIELRNHVQKGDIGNVMLIKSCSRDSPTPTEAYLKTCGHFFHDCFIHDIDFFCWILGSYPESVYAEGYALNPNIKERGDIDNGVITMKFPNSIISVSDISRYGVHGYHQTIEVHAEKAVISSENQREKGIHYADNNGTTLSPIKFSFPQRYNESYHGALVTFIDAIDGKVTIDITKQSTVRASEVADACEISLKEGRRINVNYSC